MAEIRDTLKGRPVEIVSGLAMVIVGVWLTAASGDATEPDQLGIAGGGLLTALGGVLLSWVAAVAFSKREATQQLNDQLDAVSRNLGHAATRVTRAVEQCQAEQLDPAAGMALIGQATTMIYGQIDQIQRLIGTKFDSDELAATLTELDVLAAKLDRQPTASSADVRREVTRILAQARSGAAGQSLTEVECPHCSVGSTAILSSEAGSTAQVTCPSCERRFNAHRRSDGRVFTRPAGSAKSHSGAQAPVALAEPTATSVRAQEPDAEAEAFTFACMACRSDITLAVRSETDSPRLMMCVACATSHFVTPLSRQVVRGEQFERSKGQIIGRSGSQPFVPCPKCRKSMRASLNDGRSRYAFCSLDQQFMEVTHEEFDLWRAQHTS